MTSSNHFTLAPAPHALLGLWAEHGPETALAFSSDERRTGRDEEPTWVVDLPDDGDAGRALLDLAQQRLRRTEAGVQQAPEQVATWLDDPRASEAVAALSAAGHGRVGEPVPVAADVVGVFTRSCTATALVETRSADRVLGQSRLALTGSIASVVVAERRAALARHQQAVLLTAASRATVLRTAALTVRTAASIAVRFALPGGPLLALPLAWSLLHRITTSGVGSAGVRRA